MTISRWVKTPFKETMWFQNDTSRKIHEIGDVFMGSEHGYWLIGVFDSFEATEMAFSLSESQRQVLQDVANKSLDYGDRVITLRAVRHELLNELTRLSEEFGRYDEQ